MSNFLQFTVFGIMLGAGYAIAATGLVVTYTTSGVFNFAQGAVGMIAAFGYWELVSAHHVPVLAALVIVLILGASISGAFVERVLMPTERTGVQEGGAASSACWPVGATVSCAVWSLLTSWVE